MNKSFVPNDILQGTVYKKITSTIMVNFENGHNFVMHAITLVIGAVVVVAVALVVVAVVVIVVAVNNCPALHSQPYCPLTDLKSK